MTSHQTEPLVSKIRSVAPANLLPHLLRPARGGAAGVVIVFAALLTLAAKAGLLGIPLALLVLSWFFKYAYILFDHVVRGVDEPPTLDIQMVNPVNEQRPLGQLIIIAILFAGLTLAANTLPKPLTYSLAAIAVLMLPASVAVLGLEGNVVKAIYPVALAKMISGLGPMYALVLSIIAGYIVAVGLLDKLHPWLPVQVAATLFATLSSFSALGGALYERRHELGLETWHSPERTAERQRVVDQHKSQTTVTEAYGLVRVGQHLKAWQVLQDWLASRSHAVEDYHWLCQSVASWPDPRYANRLTADFVDRLLALKRNGEALDVVARRLRLDQRFRPTSSTATFKIAELAARGGGAPSVARTLLRDFGQRFAGDPLGESAEALARHLGE